MVNTRCCFCLFSYGDPKQILAQNHRNHLHHFWKSDHLFPDEEAFQISFKNLTWSILTYPVGMIAYALDTVAKSFRLVGNILVLIAGTMCHDRFWVQNRAVVVLDSSVALLISIVGIILPPLAYKLDEAASRCMQGMITKKTSIAALPVDPIHRVLEESKKDTVPPGSTAEVVEDNVLPGDSVVVEKLQDA